MSKIEWTEKTWNPIVGCKVVSPGCKNCYAMRQAHRLASNPQTPRYHGTTQMSRGGPVWTGKMSLAPDDVLTQPLRRKTPTLYFVNSMSDLFADAVPDEWIDRVFAIMALCPQHTFQVLTKRAGRMRAYLQNVCGSRLQEWAIILTGSPCAAGAIEDCKWPIPNVWLGVSVEDQTRADERIPDLLATPAALRFISAEPLLGPVSLRWLHAFDENAAFIGQRTKGTTNDLDGLRRIDWVIVGGESGPGARPMHPNWARTMRDQCAAAEVPFFFKQWGYWLPSDQACPSPLDGSPVDCIDTWDWADADERGALHHWTKVDEGPSIRLKKHQAGRFLDGETHDAMPEMRA